ncbi:MAG: D-alanyl-D-alanine carboxypeptidase/D-alanyl-D-alanine-endopeptidase [Fidelibacterota bacterium]
MTLCKRGGSPLKDMIEGNSFEIKYLFLILILVSCVNTPQLYRETGNHHVRSVIRRAIDHSGLSTNLGIKIVSLKTNKTLYELNANSLFNPASNNKLFTCISTLALIDTGYTFSTSVYRENNNLYLVGGGDPDLSLISLDSLARITSAYVVNIDTLFLDESILDTIRFGEGWMWDEGPWEYAAQISALTVNDNCVDFYITPGELNQPVQFATYPEMDYFQISNQSITVNDTIGFMDFEIDRDWGNRTNIFTITGMVMDTASVDTFTRNVDDPSQFTGNLFNQMLKDYGVEIQTISKRKYSGNGELLAKHRSESLIISLRNLMKESDNLTAELLVKMIGHEMTDSVGTWQNGLAAIKTFLNDELGLDTTSLNLADGSGVSRYNYSSPEHFIHLLTWAYENEQIRDNLISTLPVGGWDGTLKERMNGDYGGRIFAKTGTLSGVSCLSGYVFTKSGEPLAFSIMMNGYAQKARLYRNLQDRITEILAEL